MNHPTKKPQMTTDPGTVHLTADMVLLADDQVLLIQRGWPPHAGAWALPGGYVEPGEASRTAAARELAEETGIPVDAGTLRQIGAYDAPDRDPRGRVVTIAYTTTLLQTITPTAADDARAARWWPLTDLPQLAFDHADILTEAIRRTADH